ncbi:MAG: enoyl-ACP reductase [Bdellovibrionales bacterium]|nr:enoyl-ACP reductase [Bdellovibrionales bacterium]
MKLTKKKILVLGLANKSSIAWGVIQKLHAEGAEVGICYFHPSNQKRVEPLSQEIDCKFVQEVDVTQPDSIERLAKRVSEEWGQFDGLVHSIAFAPASALETRFYETTYHDFATALNISAFSLLALTNKLRPSFAKNFSIVSMTCYGASKVICGYNIMGVAKAALESITRYLAEDLGKDGVRVNTISSGPIKTLAALGVPNFSHFLNEIKEHSPMRANVTIEDVGNMTSFLMSDESRSISGQTLFVDSGMSIIVR